MHEETVSIMAPKRAERTNSTRTIRHKSTRDWKVLLCCSALLFAATSRVEHAMAFSPSYFRVRPSLLEKSSAKFQGNCRLPTHLTTTTTAEIQDYVEEQVNLIQPKTKTLPKSMLFYARFVKQRIEANRLAAKEKKVPFSNQFQKLNEARRNLVKLAGYNSGIAVPSFGFLLLGALMMSIIPHYYSECITCVASNEASRIKCFRALGGLAVTSTLGALFTGARGSLFWIAGELCYVQ